MVLCLVAAEGPPKQMRVTKEQIAAATLRTHCGECGDKIVRDEDSIRCPCDIVKAGWDASIRRKYLVNGGMYQVGELSFPWVADNRDGQLSGRLETTRGYRTVGGDRGDVRFTGFGSDEDGTTLTGVVFVSSLEFTDDEAREEAINVIAEAYASVGPECVEHS